MGPAICVKLPQPCLHRYDPISLALAACGDWTSKDVGEGKHFSGTSCRFGIPLPGIKQTGTFDLMLDAKGKIAMYTTNMTTKTGPTTSRKNETATATATSTKPNPENFKNHCTPKSAK